MNHFKKLLVERKSKKMTINLEDTVHELAAAALKPKVTLERARSESLISLEDELPKGLAEDDNLAKAIHEIDLNLEPNITPSFYYYKRWLWIAFPWLCLQPDKRYNYSNLIYECYSSNLKYLSVGDDMLLTERRTLSSRFNQNRKRNKTEKTSVNPSQQHGETGVINTRRD